MVRWLPSSGRYRLQQYLPVFMWRMWLREKGLDPFWHLIQLLSTADSMALFDTSEQHGHYQDLTEDVAGEMVEAENKSGDEEQELCSIPCISCGEIFLTKDSAVTHMINCDN